MDVLTKRKWDRASVGFDVLNAFGAEKRWAPTKHEFFGAMRGKVLFVAVGTGLDIPYFPSDLDIVGIDISDRMLARARPRAEAYHGRLELRHLDVHEMDHGPETFDQVFTSCTFCSVPDPVRGLESVRRVLKPGGELRMFEHTGSRHFPFNLLLHLMNPIAQAWRAGNQSRHRRQCCARRVRDHRGEARLPRRREDDSRREASLRPLPVFCEAGRHEGGAPCSDSPRTPTLAAGPVVRVAWVGDRRAVELAGDPRPAAQPRSWRWLHDLGQAGGAGQGPPTDAECLPRLPFLARASVGDGRRQDPRGCETARRSEPRHIPNRLGCSLMSPCSPHHRSSSIEAISSTAGACVPSARRSTTLR